MENQDLTIEGFFLRDYQRIRQRNEELKLMVDEYAEQLRGDNMYGLHCQQVDTEVVKIGVAGVYRIKNKDSPWNSIEKINAMLKLDDDALYQEALKSRDGNYGSWFISYEKKKFEFLIRANNIEHETFYLYSFDNGRSLVDFCDEAALECWCLAELEDECRDLAIKELRENMQEAKRVLDSEETD